MIIFQGKLNILFYLQGLILNIFSAGKSVKSFLLRNVPVHQEKYVPEFQEKNVLNTVPRYFSLIHSFLLNGGIPYWTIRKRN